MIATLSIIFAFVAWFLTIHVYDWFYEHKRPRKKGDGFISLISPLFLIGGIAMYWISYFQGWSIGSSFRGNIWWTVILFVVAVFDWLLFIVVFCISYDSNDG